MSCPGISDGGFIWRFVRFCNEMPFDEIALYESACFICF